MRALGARFVAEWTIATTFSSLVVIATPVLSPLFLGVCQWLVLRRYVSRGWVWLLVTTTSTYLSAFGVSAFGLGFMFAVIEGARGGVAVALFLLTLLILFLRSGFQCISLVCIPQQRRCGWWLIMGTLAAMFWCAITVVLSLMSVFWHAPPVWRWLSIYGLSGAIAGVIEGRSLLFILERKT